MLNKMQNDSNTHKQDLYVISNRICINYLTDQSSFYLVKFQDQKCWFL